MDKQTFLETYRLREEDLNDAGISWEELALIEKEYRATEHSLRDIGKSFIDDYLYDIETAGIHSYRYRTKDVEHLRQVLADRFYFAKIYDESRILIRPEDYLNDVSLKGEFVRRVLASDLSDTEKERVIACGFRALTGEEIGL